MTGLTLNTRLVVLASLLSAVFCITIPSFCIADEAAYFYDDAGRLEKVVKGTEAVVYQYDEVGNLLSVARETVTTDPPVLQNIVPEVLVKGTVMLVSLQGRNLFTTKEVSAGSSSLTIRPLSVTDAEVAVETTVSPDAIPGTVTLTLVTLFGSANIQATVSSAALAFKPQPLVVSPQGAGAITAAVTPSVGRDLRIIIRNSDPSVAAVPKTVTIPLTGTTDFAVNGLKAGGTTIACGSAETDIFVTETALTGTDLTTYTPAVSVAFDAPRSDGILQTPPMSVFLGAPSGESLLQTQRVSVHLEASSGSATAASSPVSVQMSQP